MRPTLLAIVLMLLPMLSRSAAQVVARQALPEESKELKQQEVPTPMLLEVPLAGNGTPGKPHIVELPPNRTRLIRDTAAYVCDQMTVKSVSIRKQPKKHGKVDLVITPTLETTYYRQKVNVSVVLKSGDREVRSWKKDELVLGFSAGDLIGGGAIGAANPDKSESPEIVWSFDSEEQLRELAGSPDARLEIVVGIVP